MQKTCDISNYLTTNLDLLIRNECLLVCENPLQINWLCLTLSSVANFRDFQMNSNTAIRQASPIPAKSTTKTPPTLAKLSSLALLTRSSSLWNKKIKSKLESRINFYHLKNRYKFRHDKIHLEVVVNIFRYFCPWYDFTHIMEFTRSVSLFNEKTTPENFILMLF